MSWWSELVCETYPAVAIFDTDREVTISELRRFARIILTEGIPFLFAKMPLAFEFGRQRAAEWIDVDPKQISVTGSARIGYSLNPKRFGEPYDPSISDVDLFLIDGNWFGRIADEYAQFIASFESGALHPRHDKERDYWSQAKEFCPRNISNGFMDQKYVPTRDRFLTSQALGDANNKFLVNVNSIAGKPVIARSSLRVYRDWNAAVDQIAYSLGDTLKKRAKA